MTNSFAISWSRLESAEQCPLQCYWKNFAPKDQRIPFDNDNPHLIKGKIWHYWMECYLKGERVKLSKDLVRHKDRIEKFFEDPPAEILRFTPLIRALRKAPGELLVEEQMTLTEKYKKCSWYGELAYWRTIYDCLHISPSGVAKSLDWKTGKVRDKSDQLKFSSAAAMLRWPKIHEISTSYMWLEHEAPPTTVTYKRKELKGIMEEWEDRVEVVKIMAEDNSWEATPSDFNCKWCEATPAQCKHSRK